jgi:hypothetical protein
MSTGFSFKPQSYWPAKAASNQIPPTPPPPAVQPIGHLPKNVLSDSVGFKILFLDWDC